MWWYKSPYSAGIAIVLTGKTTVCWADQSKYWYQTINSLKIVSCSSHFLSQCILSIQKVSHAWETEWQTKYNGTSNVSNRRQLSSHFQWKLLTTKLASWLFYTPTSSTYSTLSLWLSQLRHSSLHTTATFIGWNQICLQGRSAWLTSQGIISITCFPTWHYVRWQHLGTVCAEREKSQKKVYCKRCPVPSIS